MGTRHYQTVIDKNAEVKIAQYGQWDGHPSGQGIEILKFLRDSDLHKYQTELDKIPEILISQADLVINDDPNWKENYPYLTRDCESKIHQMIQDGNVEFVFKTTKEEAERWCEGFYTIDFTKGEFISEFYGTKSVHKLHELPSDEDYLKDFEGEFY